MSSKADVTRLLKSARQENEEALEELFPVIYDELKKMAYSQIKKEHDDVTLTGTELVHEAYMKMIDQTKIEAEDKNHFIAIAACCMREILVDHARKKKAEKRGGDQKDLTYIDKLFKIQHQAEDVINLDEKLDELAQLNQRLADVVELRFFGNLSIYNTAQVLGISESTVKRDWNKARGWLYKELEY